MTALTFLILTALFLFGFKVLGLIVKANFLLISVPLMILTALAGAVLSIVLMPAAIVTAIAAALLPLGFIGPLLPLFLVLIGVHLIVRG